MFLSFLVAGATHGATITVVESSPGVGAVDFADDTFCSLREAIVNAIDNAVTHSDCPQGSGADTIVLPAGATFTLSDAADLSGVGNSGLPVVSSSLTIEGNGSIIERSSSLGCALNNSQAGTEFRLLRHTGGALTIENVTLRGGCVDGNNAGSGGGAILSSPSLSSRLTLRDVAIIDNAAYNDGGGVDSASPTLLIERSLFSSNAARLQGGGLNGGGTTTVRNTTFSSNSADEGGGLALYNSGQLRTHTLEHLTFAGNTATSSGGGIYNRSSTINAKNIILQGSTCGERTGANWNATGANFDSGSTCSGFFGAANFTDNAALALGGLAANGGPTGSHALGLTSDALHAATDCTTYSGGSVIATDQRGIPRPQGPGCDAGAFEVTETSLGLDRDFGDAPDPGYPTLAASAGARHVLTGGLFLGACADAEADAQPTAVADGDDTNVGSPDVGTCAVAGDDGDGVAFTSSLVAGGPATVEVTASASGLLDGWIDWNGDGDWDDAGEQVFASESLMSGASSLGLTVPAGATPGATFARFRLSSAGGLAPTGFASDGEVEDYSVTVEPSIQISIDDVTALEGDAGTTAFDFTVSVSSTAIEVSVTAATANGSAAAGEDYAAVAPDVLTFSQGGPLTRTVTVQVGGDATVEADETFTVGLSSPTPGSVIADSTGLGTIQNDDVATLSIDDAALPEGDAGSTSVGFTVTLDGAVAGGLTVDFTTADGSATTADGDYTAIAGTLTFAGTQGETQGIPVAVLGDVTVEPDETFTVDLSNLQAGGLAVTLADSTGSGTIENDDAASLSIDDVTLPEGDAGPSPFDFLVTLDGAVAGGLTVDFASADGSATTADGDYTATAGTLTFAGTQGETQGIPVAVLGDATAEPDETFTVDLSNLQAGGLAVTLADATGLGSIEDDDAVKYQAEVIGSKEAAGDPHRGGAVVYTIVLTNLGPGLQQDNPEDELVDVLPPELELLAAAADSGTAVADLGANTVTWNGEIPAGDSVTILVDAVILEDTPLETAIANQGTILYDIDGFGSNEASRLTDDPGTPDAEDPTVFLVSPASVLEIPTLGEWALSLLALALAGLGVARLRG